MTEVRDGREVMVAPAAAPPANLDLASCYRRHAADLTAFAAGLVGRDDAADVVATAVARVVAGGHWAGVRDGPAFLYRSVYQEALTARRSWRRRQNLAAKLGRSGGDGRGGPASPSVAADAAPGAEDPAVVAAVRSLPVQQRAVVVLTYWQDLHPDEVAARLGISPGSVKKHLARARAALRRTLA